MKRGIVIALKWLAVTYVCVLIFLYVVSSVAFKLFYKGTPDAQAVPQAAVCSVDAGKLLGYINAERSKLGAPELVVDATIATAAKYKLDDMAAKKYFAHKMPDNTEWHAKLRSLGVNATTAENIGSNDSTPEQSWEEFKSSPSHYSSMTDPQYTRIGIATQCTDYTLELALEAGDEQYVGTKVTDLTVVTLAGVEPKAQQYQPQAPVTNYVTPSYRPSTTYCTHNEYTYFNDTTTCRTY